MDSLTKNRLEDLILRNEVENVFWLAKNTKIESIIQNGPQCGIVALCMALKHLNKDCSVEILMQKAKELNFTKNGEIFDVKYLNELALIYSECKIVELNNEIELLKYILSSKLVLIPYDCDFNFEPCQKQGLKAHWALITGYSLPIDLSNSLLSSSFLKSDNIDFNLLNNIETLDSDQTDNLIQNYEQLINDKIKLKQLIYVFCKHGKSKQIGVWNLSSLIESNRQIQKVDDVKCNSIEFTRPLDGDISKTLGSKFLVFL